MDRRHLGTGRRRRSERSSNSHAPLSAMRPANKIILPRHQKDVDTAMAFVDKQLPLLCANVFFLYFATFVKKTDITINSCNESFSSFYTHVRLQQKHACIVYVR